MFLKCDVHLKSKTFKMSKFKIQSKILQSAKFDSVNLARGLMDCIRQNIG